MSPRTFCKVFWMMTAGALATVAVFNFLLDPHGNFDVGLVKPYFTSTHISKALAVREYLNPPDLLILGSSRVMFLGGDFLRESYGWSTFNGGVQEGKPADAIAMYRYVADTSGSPKRVLLAVETEMLQAGFRDSPTIYPSPLWSYYISPCAHRLTLEQHIHPFFELFSLEQSIDSLRLVRRELFPERQPELQSITLPDGTMAFPVAERKIQAGQYDLQAAVQHDAWTFTQYHTWNAELSVERQADLEAFLSLVRQQGGELYVFLPPYHPAVLDALCQHPTFRVAYVNTRQYLAQLQSTYGFVFRDLTDILAIGGDPNQFYDGIHPRPENARLIMKALFNGEDLAVDATEPIACVQTLQSEGAAALNANE